MIELYRIENPNTGHGPYHTLGSMGDWQVQDHTDSRHPSPPSDGYDGRLSEQRCACTLEQFVRWFDAKEVQNCLDRGLRVIRFDAYEEHVIVLGHQCLVHVDADRFSLMTLDNWKGLYAN